MDQTHNLPLFCPQVAVVGLDRLHHLLHRHLMVVLVAAENNILRVLEVLVTLRSEAHHKVMMEVTVQILILLEVAAVRVGLEVMEMGPRQMPRVMAAQESLTQLLGRQ